MPIHTIDGDQYDIPVASGDPIKLNKFDNDIAYLVNKYNKPGWNTYDALPLSTQAGEQAQRFKDLAEKYFVKGVYCGMAPDSGGYICFDWFISHDNQISIDVTTEGNLVYYGCMGEKEICDDVKLKDKLPQTLVSFLEELIALSVERAGN
jgi:hypothetical protein